MTDTQPVDIYNMLTEYLASRDPALKAQLDALADTLPPAFPGAAYRQAIAQPEQVTEMTGTVTLLTGETFPITQDDIVPGTLSISGSAVPDIILIPGGVPSSELRLTLRDMEDLTLYGAEIAMTFRIQRRNEHWCEIPLGTFSIAEASDENETDTAITAYDDMMRLDAIPFSALDFVPIIYYDPQQIITAIAQAAGFTYTGDVSGYVNGTERFDVRSASGITTARDLLMHILQVICAFAYIDRFRILRVVPLQSSAAAAENTAGMRHSARISRIPYRLASLSQDVTLPQESGTDTVLHWHWQTLWDSGADVTLPVNPLWYVMAASSVSAMPDAVSRCLRRIADALEPIVYYPAELETCGDPAAEWMEWLRITGRPREAVIPMTEHVWRYRGGASVNACGQEAVASIAVSQAEKAARAARDRAAAQAENIMRLVYLRTMQSYVGLHAFTYREIAHYTYAELGGKTL